ncbi:MAG: RNA polymerase sigma factor [Planctomycetota bacterium]
MTGSDEERIGQGLRAGDAAAWYALYDALAPSVWQFVGRRLGPNSAEVADVVQEIFLAAASSARNYDSARGTLWAWLSGIAQRQVALHFRKRSRRAEVEQRLAESAAAAMRWMESGAEDPACPLEAAELAGAVHAALGQLTDEYAALLSARYFDDESIDSMAQRTASSAEAVRSRLARARRAFHSAFVRLQKPQTTP